MEPNQNLTSKGLESHNLGYTHPNALQIRLETDTLLLQLKEHLEGKLRLQQIDPVTHKAEIAEIASGVPLMNAEGVHSIISFMRTMINPSTVQGNFTKEEDFQDFISDKKSALLDSLVSNAPNWELDMRNTRMVYHSCIGLLQTFMSRLIFNKERESYAATFSSTENTTNGRKGLFG